MSFTVIRYKNGQAHPIKLSIWDAFKGVPTPKLSKAKPCRCCNKVHPRAKQGATGAEVTGATTTEKDIEAGISESQLKGNIAQSHSAKDAEVYSQEDDAKVIEMKAAQNSWKQILAAIDKESLSQLKERWKTINPTQNDQSITAAPSADGNKSSTTVSRGKRQDPAKQAEIERLKAEGQARKLAEQAKVVAEIPGTAVSTGAEEPKGDELQSNDMKSFATRYDKHKWVAAASKHFDLTGQRITPGMAKSMAEGK